MKGKASALFIVLLTETLCYKSLKIDHMMEVAVKTVNFIHARCLHHSQFDNLLNAEGISHGLPYYTEVSWLSCGIVLKWFF